ncbi:hypothetical protein B0T24DRAFT_139256, partial [Lasiosphaeria ovina]
VVGGFGRNQYLYHKIGEYCSQRGIEIQQPKNPWEAVALGAVCRCLEPPEGGLVAVRLARKSYGTPASELFRQGVHDPDDMYIDRFTGRKMARGQMTWLCGDKGDRLPEDQPRIIGIELVQRFEPHEGRELYGALVGCVEDTAPRRFVDNAAQVICRVESTFHDIPDSALLRCRDATTGKEYFEVDFKLEATMGATELTWRLLYNGKEYGSTSVSYDI